MKIRYFSLCYLGGEVDLVKLRAHLAAAYPGATLDIMRGRHVANLPLASGTLDLEDAKVPYDIVCHQFDSGFGTIVLSLEADQSCPESTLFQAQHAAGGRETAMAAMGYFNRIFGTRDAGELFYRLRKPEVRKQVKEGPGVDLLTVGLDLFNIGIHEFNCLWLIGGGGEAKKPDWRDLTGGRGELWAGDTNQFWSPQESSELYWDMVAVLLREHSSSCNLLYSKSWLGALNQQLKQTGLNLRQRNEELWNQDRDDIEAMEINFLGFSIHLRDFMLDQGHLYRRDAPPFNLRYIEPSEWEQLSRYRVRSAMIGDVMGECKHIIERMTRPLDFREFKLLKSGVEEVEARIMMLTVLLVIMELFAQAMEPGHWHLKAVLLALMVLIPGSFLLWMRAKRTRTRLRGREMYLRNLKEKNEEEARSIEQQMMVLRESPGIEPKTRDHYLGVYQGIEARIRQRAAEIDEELGNR